MRLLPIAHCHVLNHSSQIRRAMEIKDFIDKLQDLKAKGFVPSLRKGSTGIGYTLESHLNIDENNLFLPDLGEIELKAHRDDSQSMITLFTFNRSAWLVNPILAVKKYGTPDDNGRLGLYFTMSRTPNSAGLFLDPADETVSIRHKDGTEIVRWHYVDLAERFSKKIPALLLVYAHVEHRGEEEWFNFYSARLLRGTNPEIIGEHIKKGTILIDLRLHDKGTMARNRGTGFRASESALSQLFKYSEVIV